MKKKAIMVMSLLALFCLAVLSGCASGGAEGGALPSETAADGGSTPAGTKKAAQVIGIDAAGAAVLKHAGLAASQVSRMEVELDHENGRKIYEVEFRSGDREYEYEIDAFTGAVLSSEYEIKKEVVATGKGSTGGSSASGSATGGSSPAAKAPSGSSVIGKDAAKAAALKHAGLAASQVSRMEVELDYEKGRKIYEVEFYSGGAEYDYEIDAYTGEVLAYEYEVKKAAPVEGGTLIGGDAAVAAALKHARLARSAVTRLEVELDYEDGRRIYEVEFYSGNKEYEYEIDAYSGTILSFEVETRKTN